MGAPLGNQNARKDWAGAIRKSLADNDGQKLRRIADKLVQMAEAGEMQAIKELGDRLDGKPSQQVDLGNAGGEPFLTKIVREVVDPNRTQDTNP